MNNPIYISAGYRANLRVALKAGLFLLLAAHLGTAQAIQKCKDSEGKWHYGDTAVAACSESKITTLNDRGIVTNQEAAPKTKEEVAREKIALDKENALLEEEKATKEERERVLNIYESEADIDRQRDNQINSVQGNIAVHEAYLKSMVIRLNRFEVDMAETRSSKKKEALLLEIENGRGRMENSRTELVALELRKQKIIDKFDKEKEVYRALTQ